MIVSNYIVNYNINQSCCQTTLTTTDQMSTLTMSPKDRKCTTPGSKTTAKTSTPTQSSSKTTSMPGSNLSLREPTEDQLRTSCKQDSSTA